ncbi:unnamed protein product [Peniophora sp. CBMAI 1063]|nr:unnamed protein product [Peniophora sp. CBMAI 1063]
MASSRRPALNLAPSVNTTVVTTTTTTTTTYAPIYIPPLPSPPPVTDVHQYPLHNFKLPPTLRQFPLVFPNGALATFRDDDGDDTLAEEQLVGGTGWRMLRQNEHGGSVQPIGLGEAVERYTRKRAYSNDGMIEEDESSQDVAMHTPPPRKKAKAAPPPVINTSNGAAPPSPLPSPRGSPSPTSIWPSAPPSGASSPQPNLPIQPDLGLTTLMSLPTLVTHFSALPPSLQSHVLISLMRHTTLPVLRTLNSVLEPTLARDFLTLLPPELVSHILSYLPFETILCASRVSKSWRGIIDSDGILWKDLLRHQKLWFGGGSEIAFVTALMRRRKRQGLPVPESLPLANPYKILFKSRFLTRDRWISNPDPSHFAFTAHGRSVVTCLLLSRGRIISASDDHSIHMYSPTDGTLIRSLLGHEGGVWALASMKDTLVSGSTDRTVRIWDMATGRCTHIFGGHTSTVRCLAIVKPEMVDMEDENGVIRQEKWPKRPLIVTGSRDHSLRVWTLPRPGEKEYKSYGSEDADTDPADEDVEENPYHRVHLEGHEHAVRALAARGRTLVSGSYDSTVRVWDIIDGTCKFVLTGHTQKVYSVVLDMQRNQCCSGSMDGTVRIWSLQTGENTHVLSGHTSLVGLLGLSPTHLVSAAADSTLRIWDPDSGDMRQMLAAHTGAITCFQHDHFKVLSGSDGTLKMWNIQDGTVIRDMLTNIVGVWQVVFEGRWCVAASNRPEATVLDVWDMGSGVQDDDWIGEPASGIYDEDETDDEDEDMELIGADEAMDQDLESESFPSEDMREDGDDDVAEDDDEDRATTYSPPAWTPGSRGSPAAPSLAAAGPSRRRADVSIPSHSRVRASGARHGGPAAAMEDSPPRTRSRTAVPRRR